TSASVKLRCQTAPALAQPSSTFKVQRLKPKGYRVFRRNSLFWGSPFPVRTPPQRSRLMRVATVIGVLLLGGAATLSAQHAHQFEIGGFGTVCRFDPALLVDHPIGGVGGV